MLKDWNERIISLSNPHLLQTREWASVKATYDWRPIPVAWVKNANGIETYSGERVLALDGELDAAVLLLRRSMPLGLSVLYASKGPLLRDWRDETLRASVLRDIEEIARKSGAIFVKIDPDVVVGRGVPGKEGVEEEPLGRQIREEWRSSGWRFSSDQIQYRNTVLVDLTAPEDDILMRMKSKTRYNIRLAGRKGVKVRVGNHADLGMLYRMYADTSLRGGFTIRGEAYYQTVWNTFLPAPGESGAHRSPSAAPLIAEVEGEPIAGAVIFRFGEKAWYLHGMSSVAHREKMPTYLIQWEAMRWAKNAGCTVYDMWGAPDVFEKGDPMWGVYRFKRGFGGQVSRTIGAWDRVLRPGLYQLYTAVLPNILKVMRRFRKQRTEKVAS